ncbi:MAG: TIGR03905 family TSCPD domain-containing protein [Clostridia bacterium]|nr:TIGR03905 family TSCPD domain-containing protein [Clostridia bacterium]
MKQFSYTPKGVCSRRIDIDLDDNDVVQAVRFTGGCSGNTKGVAALCVGRNAREIIRLLKGIPCGPRPTSCPDQLALALESYLQSQGA